MGGLQTIYDGAHQFDREIEGMLNHSHQRASKLKNEYYASPFKGSVFSNSFNTYSFGNSYGDRGSSGKDKNGVMALGLLALGALAYTFYSFGKSLGDYRASRDGLESVVRDSAFLARFKEIQNPQTEVERADKTRLERVIEASREMFQQSYDESKVSLLTKALLIASLAAVIIGALTVVFAATASAETFGGVLLGIGVASTFFTGLFALLREGYGSRSNDTVAEKARTVINAIELCQNSVGGLPTYSIV